MFRLTGAAKRPKTLFENFDWLVTPNERAGAIATMEGVTCSARGEAKGMLDAHVLGAAK